MGGRPRTRAASASHRQIPRREDRSRDRARELAAMNVAGSLHIPGDKSISHRALILAALGDGLSRITGILESADVHSTAGVLRALGAPIPALSPDFVVVGRGARGLGQP